jgi:hypothetical protein
VQFTNISFQFKSYNPAFTQVEIWFRFIFLLSTFAVTVSYKFAHTNLKSRYNVFPSFMWSNLMRIYVSYTFQIKYCKIGIVHIEHVINFLHCGLCFSVGLHIPCANLQCMTGPLSKSGCLFFCLYCCCTTVSQISLSFYDAVCRMISWQHNKLKYMFSSF